MKQGSSYADDTLCWAAGARGDEVRQALELLSTAIVDYAGDNYLAINEGKTQVLWAPSSSSSSSSSFPPPHQGWLLPGQPLGQARGSGGYF